MNPAALYLVPKDDQTPYPLTLARLQQAFEDIGHQPELIKPEGPLGLVMDDVPFIMCLDRQQRYLSIRCVWDTMVPHTSTHEALLVAADSWNRERYFPTIYSVPTAAGSSEVVADYMVSLRQGLSNDQLADSLRVALSTGVDAILYMQDAAHSLLDIEFPFPAESPRFEGTNG